MHLRPNEKRPHARARQMIQTSLGASSSRLVHPLARARSRAALPEHDRLLLRCILCNIIE